jgi:DNA-binding XRE family transcriptional regulator
MIETQNSVCKNTAHFKTQTLKICTLITECRKKSGQTQKDMAEWCGMSLRTYIELEKGNCTIENLFKAADKFDVDITINFKA